MSTRPRRTLKSCPPGTPVTAGVPPAFPSRYRSHVAAALAAGLLSLAALAVQRGLEERAPATIRRERGLDVVLITVDTLRADALGAYGSRRGATPWMDRLASAGVVFRQAHAHNVVTLPSHTNLLTGRYPFDHGVRDNAGFRLPADAPTLATRLRGAGYRTGAFVSAFTLDSRFGLDRGFDVYDDSFGEGAETFVLPERRGADTVEAARRWRESGDTRPSFTWVHVYDPHAPYRPPEPHASRFPHEPYFGDVASADEALGALLAPLLEAGEDGHTLVVLTADHGESLGEHGERTHGLFAYQATLRVPLVLFAPRLLTPRVVGESVGHVDVLPTILDALGLSGDGLSGRSLLPLAVGQSVPAVPTYFEALSGFTNRGWAPLYGVVRGGEKYIELPEPELYDLDADPGETRNLVATEAEAREALQLSLLPFRSADRGLRSTAESAETRERLRALGYLASPVLSSDRKFTADDDPKRLVELDALMEDVIARHRLGDVTGALALCEDLVRRRPQMPAGLMQLALLHRRQHDLPAAVDALRRAVALAPDDAGLASLLGHYLSEAGLAAEAARLLEPYAARPDVPLDILTARGIALTQLGRTREALTAFGRARALDPSNAMVRVQSATVHLLAAQLVPARRELEEALRLDRRLAPAHHSLGLVAAREGDTAAALRHWRAAVELDPGAHDPLLRLGLLLVQQGRRQEGRAYLERFLHDAPRPLYDREIARVRALLGDASHG